MIVYSYILVIVYITRRVWGKENCSSHFYSKTYAFFDPIYVYMVRIKYICTLYNIMKIDNKVIKNVKICKIHTLILIYDLNIVQKELCVTTINK